MSDCVITALGKKIPGHKGWHQEYFVHTDLSGSLMHIMQDNGGNAITAEIGVGEHAGYVGGMHALAHQITPTGDLLVDFSVECDYSIFLGQFLRERLEIGKCVVDEINLPDICDLMNRDFRPVESFGQVALL